MESHAEHDLRRRARHLGGVAAHDGDCPVEVPLTILREALDELERRASNASPCLIEAARAVADQVTPEQLKLGMLFPPRSRTSWKPIKTAARVARVVFDSNLAGVERHDDCEAFIRNRLYKPEYRNFVYSSEVPCLTTARETRNAKQGRNGRNDATRTFGDIHT